MIRLDGSNIQDLATAIRLLQQGEVVAVPSETVYGLAGNALNLKAVHQIFRAKGRPFYDPLIVHIAHFPILDQLAHVGQIARCLAEAFWPGPLTLVLPRREIVPDLVTAGHPTVAVRMPAHPVFRQILTESGLALAAPSANPFGATSPTRPEHVINGLSDSVQWVVDGGPCLHGVESTIIKIGPDRLTLLRPGPISRSAIAEVTELPVDPVPRPPSPHAASVSGPTLPEAPGCLPRHYAPKKPLRALPTAELGSVTEKRTARVFLFPPQDLNPLDLVLSPDQRPESAAQALYACLHTLDADPRIDEIMIETPPPTDPWDAIRDRIQRATH